MKTYEKEQEEIIFNNIQSDCIMGFWSSYPYKSMGNIIHWLYVYCNLNIAENCTIGDSVFYEGEKIADFEWDDELKMPIFKWTDYFKEKYDYYVKNQEIFLKKSKQFLNKYNIYPGKKVKLKYDNGERYSTIYNIKEKNDNVYLKILIEGQFLTIDMDLKEFKEKIIK